MARQPDKIGHYIIHSELGRGGMAIVYRATDTRYQQTVALKALPSGYIQNENLVRRFLREGESLARMRHPNVVHVYETGRANDYFYIAMEMATGGTLAQRLKSRTSISNREIAAIISQVAAGLDYAHSRGLIHRDIKPSNIMFTQKGQAILTDFGIAKDMSGNQTRITVIGTTIGTPAYMSPEQARAEQVIDQRSDIYSLGVVAYHMLTGQVPFNATSHGELITLIANKRPPPAQSINPRIPNGVARVLDQVLAPNPQGRFSSTGAFAQALAGVLTQSKARPESVVPPPEYSSSSQQTRQMSRSDRKRGGGRLGTVLLSAAGLLAVVALFWAMAAQLNLLPGGGNRGPDNRGESVGIGAPPPPLIPAMTPTDVTPTDVTPTARPTVVVVAGRSDDAPTKTPTTGSTATRMVVQMVDPTGTPASRLTETSTKTPIWTPTSVPINTSTAMPTSTPALPPTFTPTTRPLSAGPTPTPTRLVIGGNATPTSTRGSVRGATSTPYVPPTATPTATPTRTATRPPATSTPTLYPTPIPTQPSPKDAGGSNAGSDELSQIFLDELNRSSVSLSYPGAAERFVVNLAGYVGGVDSSRAASLLAASGAGNRTKALIQNVWSDWVTRAQGDPWGRAPGNELTPFRQLVVRIIQGSQGSLSSTQLSAIINYYTRTEDPNIWFGNINGVIGAINRENF